MSSQKLFSISSSSSLIFLNALFFSLVPVMHILFAFCLLSMASSLYLLKTRWKSFREKEFSPAHVSFCAPLVSHTNAMQAYRSSLNKFSSTLPSTLFKASLELLNQLHNLFVELICFFSLYHVKNEDLALSLLDLVFNLRNSTSICHDVEFFPFSTKLVPD